MTVVHWIEIALVIAMSGAMAFAFGRAPLPKKIDPPPVPKMMTSKQFHVVGCLSMMWVMPLVISFNGLQHGPMHVRVTAVCGSYVAMAIAWFIGSRIRERKGEAPFVYPLPEGRPPTWDERLARFLRRRISLLWVVCLFGSLILNETRVCNSPSYRVRGFSCERVD